MPELQRWSDDRLDDHVRQVWAAIDDLPNRVTRTELRDAATSESVARLEQEFIDFRAEFRKSRQGLSTGEKIALFGSCGGFLGALVAAAALLLGS